MADYTEWELLDDDLTTKLGILPATQTKLYLQLNEPGSGSLRIPASSPSAALVATGMFCRLTYRGAFRGGFFVETIRAPRVSSGERTEAWVELSGRGALAILADAMVWDDNTGATTRAFENKTKAYILKTLIDEAQARGALANLAYDFTATDDTNSVSWTDSESMQLTVGTSLLDVVRNMAALGIEFDIELETDGTFTLHAYKNAIGTDKSSTVYFRVGVNCEELTETEMGLEIKNALRVKYANGYIDVSDPTSITAHRRRESLLHADEAQRVTTAQSFGNAELQGYKNPRKPVAIKVYDGMPPSIFTDYALGDTVRVDNQGDENDYRIRGLQMWIDSDKVYADIVIDINDLFDENQLRIAREVARLHNLLSTAHDAGLLEVSFWGAIGGTNTDGAVFTALLDGDNIYVGGSFTQIGGIVANRIAKYNISSNTWSALGSGIDEHNCYALAIIGTDLYVGGNFVAAGGVTCHGIAKWDGASWSALGTGLGGVTGGPSSQNACHALAVIGTDLYVAGRFLDAGGGANTNTIAKWDGTWSSIASGVFLDVESIGVLAVDGTDLYVGGTFTISYLHIAKYNGSTWSALGTGLDGICYALLVSGTSLYVGGNFTDADGVTVSNLAVWDGANFSDFGGGANDVVACLATDGLNIYAGGSFTVIGGVSINRIAGWNGSSWFSLGTGVNASVNTILPANDNIYAAGSFTIAGGNTVQYIAVYITTFENALDYLEHGSDAQWGRITGDIDDQLDLIARLALKLSIAGHTANRIPYSDASGNIAFENDLQYYAGENQIWLGSDPLTGFTVGTGFHAAAEGDASKVARARLFHFGTQTSGPALATYAAGGTKGSPTHVTAGMILGQWSVGGTKNDGDQPVQTAYIRAIATADWTSTSTPFKWVFYLVPNDSTTPTLILTIDEGTFDVSGDLTARFYSTGFLGSVTGTEQSPPPEYVVPVGSRVWIYDAGGGLSGDFVGHDTHIAYRVSSSVWQYHIPGKGEIIYLESNNAIYAFDGSAWIPAYAALIDHAASHEAGGGDPIKLDDLASPDDNTDLNASISTHGLAPKGSGDASQYWGGDWQLHDLPETVAFYMDSTDSDVGGYESLQSSVPGHAIANIGVSCTAADTLIAQFLSAADPLVAVITQAVPVHVHLAKTAGVKNVTVYAKVFIRHSGGTETALGTSDSTTNLAGSNTPYNLLASIPAYTFVSGDRIGVRIYGTPNGAGTDPTATLYYDGDTLSHVEFGTQAGGGSYTDEQAQDAVGAMVSGNVEERIAVTYDDTGAKLNFKAFLPPNFRSRGTIANNNSDANNDIDFQARMLRDSTDAVNISVAALTKRLDASWAVGTNQGGLDTGSKANSTWYHCYAIMRSDTGVTDYIFSTSASSPTMPANYDYYAKLQGQSILTNGSGNILAFLDDGDTITWKGGEVTDLNGGTSTTGALVTLTVPPGEKVEAIIDALSTTPAGGGALRVYDADIGTTINLVAFRASIAGNLGGRVDVKVNTSAQVRYYVTTGGTGYIYTQGWRYGHLQR